MQKPVQVTFKGMDVVDDIEATCLEEAQKLERHYDRLTGCRVVVTQPHQNKSKGNLYEIRIDVTAPGFEFAVNRVPADHHKDEDLHVAVKEAFRTARRRLEDAVSRKRRDVKHHEQPGEGRIARIMVLEDCGFIETTEGEEVYFHRNSVSGDFEKLEVGAIVRFSVEQGDKGPQAAAVHPA